MERSRLKEELGFSSPSLDSLLVVMTTYDTKNLEKVIKILDEGGWPSRSKVGDEGIQALFLVIQHADLHTQEKYIPVMRQALERGDLSPGAFAMLQDRILLRKGNKQLYGSQIAQNVKTGFYYVQPLSDPENVDKRRLEVGMNPMSDYVKRWGLEWSLEEYEKGLQNQEEKKLLHRPALKSNKQHL